jgi:hypothetical protein
MKPRAHAHKHKRQELSALTGRLRRQSRKITGPRQAILEILRRHPHPMTNREIFAAMPRGRCDLATIYRAIHLLEGMEMVKRFDFGDGASGKATTDITTISFAPVAPGWWKLTSVFSVRLNPESPRRMVSRR